MKSKILKSLTWVSGLFLLTLLLLGQSATAQQCPAPSSAYSNSYYGNGYGNSYGNGYGYYAPAYANNGKQSYNRYNSQKGKRNTKAGHNYSYGHNSRYYNNRPNPFYQARIGSAVSFMPKRAVRFVDRRGRACYRFNGLVWQEERSRNRGRHFRAISRVR